jgi:Spy/CpxP family protein refolding chaperone
MNFKIVAAALLGAATLTFAPVVAQTPAPATDAAAVAAPDKPLTAADLEGLRTELRSSKKQLTAAALTLTDAQATKFWPVYDQYIAELTKINDSKYALIADYVNNFGKFDDKTAIEYTKKSIDVEVRVAQLRAKYVPIVNRVLPGVQTATFFQIDRRLQSVIDLKLATQLPIMQLQTQATK